MSENTTKTLIKEESLKKADLGLLADLNAAQLEAVTHESGPLLIIAGAGTGKTTVITKRIAWLITEKGIKPDEILALTFTEKAATEMEERVDRILPYGYVDLWISTFHSFAEKILRGYALDIGLSPDFKLLDTTAAWMLVRKNLDRFNLKYYRPLGNPTKFIHALLSHFGRAKDELVTAQQYLAYVENLKLDNDSAILINGAKIEGSLRSEEIARLEEIADAYHAYEQLLLEKGMLDFGGLLTSTVDLLRNRPVILEKFRKQFKYVLVDEFQDTNIAQYELVKLLAAPINNLTIVGDDDQAIYKFRGASISNILEFKEDFPQSKEVFLIENYRSRQKILDLAYTFVAQNNPNRLEVRLGTAGLSKKLNSARTGEGLVTHLHTQTIAAEARLAAETILTLREKNPEISWNDFAILVRANDHASPFIRVFDEIGIPYELVTARGLYAKPVILDVICYAKLLDNYHESAAMYRVLVSPMTDFTEADITNFIYWARRKSISLYETLRQAAALKFSEEAVREATRILGLIEKHGKLARREPASRVLLTVLDEVGYLKLYANDDSETARSNVYYLNQLYKKINNFEIQEKEPTVKKFIEELEWEIDAGEEGKLPAQENSGPESVKILTCHAAKGLEFRYVFIANLVDRRFPSSERREPIELPDALVKEKIQEGDVHLEEERRLFYVACTRAMDGLFFTSADDYGGARKKKLSRFLLELKGLDCLSISQAASEEEKKLETKKIDEIKTRNLSFEHEPKYISFTKLKAFEACPLQYKYAHILKIPVFGRPTFSFGKTIHAALQRFCEEIRARKNNSQTSLFVADKTEETAPQMPVSLDELFAIYEASWIDDWFESDAQKKSYFEKGKALLKLFYKDACVRIPNPVYLEQAFNLKIGDYTIKGAIDRVDGMSDGSLEIIDYKTGNSKAENKIEKDQLYIYQLAMQEVLKTNPSKLTFYYVEDGKQVSFIGTSEDLQKLKEKIIAQAEAIKKSSFPPTPKQSVCGHCDFKSICEFRELG